MLILPRGPGTRSVKFPGIQTQMVPWGLYHVSNMAVWQPQARWSLSVSLVSAAFCTVLSPCCDEHSLASVLKRSSSLQADVSSPAGH